VPSEGDRVDADQVNLSIDCDKLRRQDALRDILPGAFADNVFDPEKAASVLGLRPVSDPDRYGLAWPGKEEAVAALQVLARWPPFGPMQAPRSSTTRHRTCWSRATTWRCCASCSANTVVG
jgi:hypothetical protein